MSKTFFANMSLLEGRSGFFENEYFSGIDSFRAENVLDAQNDDEFEEVFCPEPELTEYANFDDTVPWSVDTPKLGLDLLTLTPVSIGDVFFDTKLNCYPTPTSFSPLRKETGVTPVANWSFHSFDTVTPNGIEKREREKRERTDGDEMQDSNAPVRSSRAMTFPPQKRSELSKQLEQVRSKPIDIPTVSYTH